MGKPESRFYTDDVMGLIRVFATAMVAALALSGCGGGTDVDSSSSQQPSGTFPAGTTAADITSVALSVTIGPEPTVWTVDLSGDSGQAYKTLPNDPTGPPTTTAPVPLSARQVADFRAMLDSVDIWSWYDWADVNRVYAPAGNVTIRLRTATASQLIDLGAARPSGWVTFDAAMEALAG